MPKNEIVSPEGVKVDATENIIALRNHLLIAFDQHRAKIITDQEAAATSMLSRGIIATLALELKNAQMRKERPDIKFLTGPKE